MEGIRSTIRLGLLVIALNAGAQAIGGEAPPYRVIYSQRDHGVEPVPAKPYAYGWFGAAPRSHWVRHFGYHQRYTQWRRK